MNVQNYNDENYESNIKCSDSEENFNFNQHHNNFNFWKGSSKSAKYSQDIFNRLKNSKKKKVKSKFNQDKSNIKHKSQKQNLNQGKIEELNLL